VTYEVKGLLDFSVQVNIPGKFSVYNSLTAIAICRHFNVSKEKVKEALLSVKVKGRVEPIAISKHFTLMIDYAHNAMSLDSVLTTLREYHPKRLVCMFGCGGNRSRDRRFEMGEISSNKADFTVVTSDNPRFEEPEAIIEDILIGVNKGPGEYVAIIDRKEAIRYCILNAKEGDVILLAGKGHEDYQEICGQKHHMDERDLIKEILIEMTEEERTKLN
jgi:UDP-N-acetylmuramoyl-L-alanyl-D-glutamate--2,6-diaminopimelate ligase